MADEEREPVVGGERQSNGKYDTFVLPVLAELVGVCFYALIAVLTFTVTGAIVAFGEGLSIAVFMVIFSHISGGHLNPAVTLGAAIARSVNVVLAIFYFIAQILGGMLGVALARAMLQNDKFSFIHGGIDRLLQPVGVGWRILGEGVLTGAWVFIYLMAVVNGTANGKKVAPFAVGLYVIIGRFASLATTGGSMNPALSFGKAVVSSALMDDAWTDHYVFWVGPLAGSLVAAILYRLLFAPSDRRWLFKSGGSQQFFTP